MSKHTPGPWGLRGYQIRADGGHGAHVATYQVSAADGALIASAPELLRMLKDACDELDMTCGGSRSVSADRIREEVRALLPLDPIEMEP